MRPRTTEQVMVGRSGRPGFHHCDTTEMALSFPGAAWPDRKARPGRKWQNEKWKEKECGQAAHAPLPLFQSHPESRPSAKGMLKILTKNGKRVQMNIDSRGQMTCSTSKSRLS